MKKRKLQAQVYELEARVRSLLERDRQRDEEWRVYILAVCNLDLRSIARPTFKTDWVDSRPSYRVERDADGRVVTIVD